ncbi:MAG: hypothetical protein CK424_06815 [Legionella sp.]|nr:MAG: hypothetical protein CK424_06815 [Legionella sp.]
MRAVNEHRHGNFLTHLESIESKLLSLVTQMRIDINLFSEFSDITSESSLPDAKILWCLHRIVTLFKQIKKGPLASRNIWLTQAGFYARLDDSIPELEECVLLLNTFGFNQPDFFLDDNRFLLGAVFLEILHTLNPKFLSDAQDFWETLSHASPMWRQTMERTPSYLYTNLLGYCRSQEAEKQMLLRECLGTLKLNFYIESLSSIPDMTRKSIAELQALITESLVMIPMPNTPVLNSEHVEQRLKIMTCLKGYMVSEQSSISTTLLSRILHEYPWDHVFGSFHSAISEPNTYAYLKPEDKLRHVFDAIVFVPQRSSTSGLWSIVQDAMSPISPRVAAERSPGEAFIQAEQPEYEPIDLNEDLYDSFTTDTAKKAQYMCDGNVLLGEMIQRLEREKECITRIQYIETQIMTYQASKERLMRDIMSTTERLTQRLTHLEAYVYNEEAIKQFRSHPALSFDLFELNQQQCAIESSCEALLPFCSQLSDQDLLYDRIFVIEQNVHQVVKQGKVLEDLKTHINDSSLYLMQYEKKYLEAQTQFLLPSFRGKSLSLPYLSILALLMASMTIALSVSVLIGSPCLSFLVWPAIAKFIMPVYAALIGVGTFVAIKSIVDLKRYAFFSLQPGVDNDTPTFEPMLQ